MLFTFIKTQELGIGFNMRNQFVTYATFNIKNELTYMDLQDELSMDGFAAYDPYESTYINAFLDLTHTHDHTQVKPGDYMPYQMIQTTICTIIEEHDQRKRNKKKIQRAQPKPLD